MGFKIRNKKNWHGVWVESAASYGMEISVAGFYPSDGKYRMLEEKHALQVGALHRASSQWKLRQYILEKATVYDKIAIGHGDL